MESVSTRPIILYAEDDHDDFESIKEALDQISKNFIILNASNGSEAVSYLENNPEALPQLVVLDLNMPVMDGKEVLEWMKQKEKFRNIPIMVFTTSSRADDVKLCLKHDCTFFRKPTLYRDLLHIAQTMLHICDQHKV